MPILADSPLKKVTLNLYHDDVIFFQRVFGDGWTTEVRGIVHNAVILRKNTKPATVADYITEDLDD